MPITVIHILPATHMDFTDSTRDPLKPHPKPHLKPHLKPSLKQRLKPSQHIVTATTDIQDTPM